MLINATQAEELRMAMVDGQRLYDLNIEGPASERKKANIYKGKITRIEPSLEAAFVDYGADRHGFLPLKEISPEYFIKSVESGKPNIKDVLKEGQDIVVQIDKEERGNKGAALTTYVSLAGRFIVLKPNKSRSGGVSRRIVGGDRDLARQSLNEIEIPENMSVILRTAGIDRSAEELAWDLENLLKVWQAILDYVLRRPSPFLIYRESNAVIRALRDYLTNEIGEILVDDEATFKEAHEFVEQVMPHNVRKLKHYVDPVPLFTRFQIETQIESAFAHQVNLPSGGSIVIDHTEALVAIDVNSARATKGGDIETTALNTNLEAAEEVARQLRIRDLGGLVVIDFIDMGPAKNQREVENRLRDSVRQDRARVQIGKITRFGLLEMSRQRLRPSIGESAYHTCPRCTGFGTIRSIESLALAILRIIGEEARKERTAKVIAQLPVEVATYLLNEKRDWVKGLETSNDTQVVLIANAALETPHYDIRRVRDDQTDLPENTGASYALAEVDPVADLPESMEERKIAEAAAIGVIKPSSPAPQRQEESLGFFARLKALFAGSDDEPKKKKSDARRSGGESKKDSGRGKPQRSRGKGEQKNAQGGNQPRKKKKGGKKKSADQGRGNNRKQKANDQPADEAAAASQPAQQDTNAADNNRDEQKRSTRSRRSRGGRRRRRSADRPQDDENQVSGDKPAAAASASNEPAQADNPADAASAADKPRRKKRKSAAKKKAANDDAGGNKDPDNNDSAAQQPSNSAPAAQDAQPKTNGASHDRDTTASNDGPPRARTDDERAADKARDDREKAPAKAAQDDAKPQAQHDTPAPSANGSHAEKRTEDSVTEQSTAKPGNRLLPWEPAAAPVEKAAQPAADNPADNSGSA
jgi:ribonuclease E